MLLASGLHVCGGLVPRLACACALHRASMLPFLYNKHCKMLCVDAVQPVLASIVGGTDQLSLDQLISC